MDLDPLSFLLGIAAMCLLLMMVISAEPKDGDDE